MKIFRSLAMAIIISIVGFQFHTVQAKGADEKMDIALHGGNAKLQTASGRDENYVIDICSNWKFGGRNLSEKDVVKPNYNDSSWETVSIPHTWNAQDGQDGDNNYLRTAYWYRKQIQWNPSFLGKKVYMEFLGSNTKTDLFVNGKHVYFNKESKEYSHNGGYTAFRYDITDYLKANKTNYFAVRVDNTFDETIAPITGDFNMYGGIYRKVYLIVTDNVHVDLENNGSSGLFLTTPKVRSKERPDTLGELNIKADIVNDSARDKTVTVSVKITGDNAPAAITREITIPAGGKYNFNENTKVENPHLWNGIDYSEGADNSDIGYRYNVELTISEGGKVIDRVSDKVGFRYFWVDKDTGFYLNGRSHPLRGVNRHQYWKGLGSAITEAEHDKDMEIIKDLGVNAIRLCHYPHSDYFYDLCDANGIVVWTEIPLVNQLGQSPNFAAATKKQLVELIRQQYNRPSVCFWGLQNEVGNGVAKNDFITMKQLINELNTLAKQADGSGRYTTQAVNHNYSMNQGREDDYDNYSNNIGWNSDLIAWNIYPGWYGNFSVVSRILRTFVKGDFKWCFDHPTAVTSMCSLSRSMFK